MNVRLLEVQPGAHHRDFELTDENMPAVVVEVSDLYLPPTDELTESVAYEIARKIRCAPEIGRGFRRLRAVNSYGQHPIEPGVEIVR